MLVIYCSLIAALLVLNVDSFRLRAQLRQRPSKSSSLTMIELEANTATYTAMFVATILPSLAFVKFIGDQADNSRGSISEETKEKFKKAMMEQPGANFAIPSTDEEDIKKQIAKAYMQDKDVDVAVLEEKLRKRIQWRKEMMAQSKNKATAVVSEDDDGW